MYPLNAVYCNWRGQCLSTFITEMLLNSIKIDFSRKKKKTEIISLNNEKRNLLSQLLSTGHVVLKLESICPSGQAAHWISIRTLDTWTMLKGLAVRTYSVQSVQFLENPDNFRVHLNSC